MENVLGKAIDPRSLFGGSKNKNPSKEQKVAKEAKTSKSSSKTSVSSPRAPKGEDNKKEKNTSSKQNTGSSSKSILDKDLEATLGGSSPKVVDPSNKDPVIENTSGPSSNKRPYSDGATPLEALQNLAIGGKSSPDTSTVPPAGNLSKKSKLDLGGGTSAEASGIDNPLRSLVDFSPPKVASSLHEESKDGSPSKVDPMGNLLQANFTSSETDIPKERNASKERNIEELFESGQHFLFQVCIYLFFLSSFFLALLILFNRPDKTLLSLKHLLSGRPINVLPSLSSWRRRKSSSSVSSQRSLL
jgi:hypothetical protein